ncbi:MAG: two-component system LytT family sensor kinase, partial [Psychromonas sp.]
ELARFSDRLEIDFSVEQSLLNVYVPTFTLQPLVENAIKHGTSTLLENGKISITGALIERHNKSHVKLQVIDNAGTYFKKKEQSGLGLQIVNKRLQNTFGECFGLQMNCKKGEWTTAEIIFPLVNDPINRKS